MALATAVGAPPVAGLYTAVFAGGTASLLGGSRFNITGSTAALVPLLAHASLQHGVEAMPMVGLMAGVLLLVLAPLGVSLLPVEAEVISRLRLLGLDRLGDVEL
jgi:SulP family sulfate permease